MISQASGSFKVLNEDKEFRVMTFNIWLSGLSVQNGVYKIAKHIRLNDPDIVAIQVSTKLLFLMKTFYQVFYNNFRN